MLADAVAGELIASEVEIRSGKGERLRGRARAPARAPPAPVRAGGRAGPGARRDRHAPLEPLAGPAHHRHAALPARRRGAAVRRVAQQHLQQPRARGRAGTRPRGRRLRRAAPGAPGAAGGVGELAVRRGPLQRTALGPHGDLHAHVPPLRHPGPLRRLGRVRVVRRLPVPHQLDHRDTQIWWSVRPHLTFGTVEVRIMDAQSCAGESTALLALASACVAQAALDYDAGPVARAIPGRLIEENLWRATRYGLDGKLIDLEAGVEVPAVAAVERLAGLDGRGARGARPRRAHGRPGADARPAATAPSDSGAATRPVSG